jgi:hypothetical protein
VPLDADAKTNWRLIDVFETAEQDLRERRSRFPTNSNSNASPCRDQTAQMDESSTAPSTSPMPDLYLGKGVSNADCDALASHARNRLQSDRDDRCEDSRRHFPFVADPGLVARCRSRCRPGRSGSPDRRRHEARRDRSFQRMRKRLPATALGATRARRLARA